MQNNSVFTDEYADEFIRAILSEKDGQDYKLLAEEMTQAMLNFTETLTDDEVFDIKTKLQVSAKKLPDNFADVAKIEGNLALIKGMVRFNSNLDECIDYLTMAQKLKYGKTGELIHKVDMVGKILNNYLSTKVFAQY